MCCACCESCRRLYAGNTSCTTCEDWIEDFKLLPCRKLKKSGNCEYPHGWMAHTCKLNSRNACVHGFYMLLGRHINCVWVCFFFLRLQDCDLHNCMSETIFDLNSLTTFPFRLWDQTVIWTLQGCFEQHILLSLLSFVICIIHAYMFLVYQVGLSKKREQCNLCWRILFLQTNRCSVPVLGMHSFT